MSIAPTGAPRPRKPVRLWPGVAAASLLLVAKFVLPIVVPDAGPFGMIGAIVGALVILLWWVFFSRARWFERPSAVVLMIVAVAATRPMLHVSIAGGMMGLMFPIFATITMSVGLVAGAVAGRRFSDGWRRATMAAGILVACFAWVLLRTD